MPRIVARNDHDEHLLLRDKTDRREARMRTKYEKKLADLRVNKEVELREARFHEVDALLAAHQLAHEREHIATSQSIEAGSNEMRLRLSALSSEIKIIEDNAHRYMTIDRFEREHESLAKRLDERWETAQAGIRAEEYVTVRQTTAAEATKEILSVTKASAESTNTNRRWLIGLAIGTVVSIVGLSLTLFSLLSHYGTS